MAEPEPGRCRSAMEQQDDAGPERLADLCQSLGGFVDPAALAQRTALQLHRALGLPLVSVAISDGPSRFAMRGTHGVRTEPFRHVRGSVGEGLGGLVMRERRLIEVQDYVHDTRITNHFLDIVTAEGVGGLVVVPVEHGGDVVGLLYGGLRSIGSIGDRAKAVLEHAARDVAPMMATSIQASTVMQRRIDAERERIAGELHDDVGQLLFSIGAAAQRLREGDNENVETVAQLIERHAKRAARRMRQAFKVLGPATPAGAAEVTLQREIEDFTARSGVAAHFIVRGIGQPLLSGAETALVGAARQALFNIERHADASLVVATLHFDLSTVSLVIQDDGDGLPDGFELRAVPRGDRYWGLASMLRQAQREGGNIDLRPGDDGGTIVRVTLPLDAQA